MAQLPFIVILPNLGKCAIGLHSVKISPTNSIRININSLIDLISSASHENHGAMKGKNEHSREQRTISKKKRTWNGNKRLKEEPSIDLAPSNIGEVASSIDLIAPPVPLAVNTIFANSTSTLNSRVTSPLRTNLEFDEGC